jgi:hypothetical protein
LDRLAAPASIAALAVLCFILGAAALHFDLPPAGFLGRAFIGGQAWVEQQRGTPEAPTGHLGAATVDVLKRGEVYDGYTLVTTSQGPEAVLLDLDGRVAHRWKMPFRRAWPTAPGVADPPPGEHIHWEKCKLFPNGDLLALCCNGIDSPYGYALAKFDKDSNLLWAYSANVHHDLDVDEDGRIYLLTNQNGVTPPPGVEVETGKYIADFVVVLGPDGKEQDVVPVFESFFGTPFLQTVLTQTAPAPVKVQSPNGDPGKAALPGTIPLPGSIPLPGDLLHTNSVRVLSGSFAPKFPAFRAGQVLLSLRTPSTLAVLDLPRRKIVWAVRGPWSLQHDAHFLGNGHLLVFDNFGSGQWARVVEYDLASQGVAWHYAGQLGERQFSPFRGGSQRLPNGNTLVVNSDGLLILEVTADERVVWRWSCPRPTPAPGQKNADSLSVTGARRYAPAQVPFLKAAPAGG